MITIQETEYNTVVNGLRQQLQLHQRKQSDLLDKNKMLKEVIEKNNEGHREVVRNLREKNENQMKAIEGLDIENANLTEIIESVRNEQTCGLNQANEHIASLTKEKNKYGKCNTWLVDRISKKLKKQYLKHLHEIGMI